MRKTKIYLDTSVINYLDAPHATVNGCQRIVSWNLKHFVNFRTMDRVNAVHLVTGYHPVKIATPSMILGELEND